MHALAVLVESMPPLAVVSMLDSTPRGMGGVPPHVARQLLHGCVKPHVAHLLRYIRQAWEDAHRACVREVLKETSLWLAECGRVSAGHVDALTSALPDCTCCTAAVLGAST